MKNHGAREILGDAVAALEACCDERAREGDAALAVLRARRQILRVVRDQNPGLARYPRMIHVIALEYVNETEPQTS